MLKLPVYLDNNATTQMDPKVLEAMLPYFIEHFGNAASRSHSFGWQAEEAVDSAREQVAKLIGAEAQEIIFTSGATEGDNLAIKGVYEMYAGKGNHIITCVTEHKAISDTCKHIEKLGGEVTYLKVHPDGLIDLKELEAAIKPTTILIAIMYANNETGVIQPVKEISTIAKKHGVLVFSDAVQAVGKIPVDVNKDGKPDLVVCGEWMKISCFENKNGQLVDATQKYFPTALSGWWNRLASADLDGDGDLDLVAANWGTNSQIKVSNTEPAALYYGDFDKNGSLDPFLCQYIQGKSFPVASRDELTDQMVSLRQRFPTYDSYSEATINDVLSPEQLQLGKVLKADSFETSWFENKNGTFIPHSLPMQANYAPVYAIAIADYNHDGKNDILLGGNIEKTRIKIGKIDANYGVLLTGDGKGNFNYMPQLSSGLNVNGCVKDIISLPFNGKKRILFSVNNQLPAVYNY